MSDNYFVLDIETDSLDANNIWMVGVKDSNLKHPKIFYKKDKDSLIKWLKKREDYFVVGHNVRKFDLPILYELWGVEVKSKIYDTLTNARKIVGFMPGGHSLKAWGIRLCDFKGELDHYFFITPAMVKYCKQDVVVTEKLYKLLINL